jgi:hypothetical protein
MGEIGREIVQPVADSVMSQHSAKRRVIWPVITAVRGIVHPNTNYEAGAEEEISEHKAAGGSLLMLMTHFRRLGEPLDIAQR